MLANLFKARLSVEGASIGDHVFQKRPGGPRRRWKVVGAIGRLRPLSHHSMRAILHLIPVRIFRREPRDVGVSKPSETLPRSSMVCGINPVMGMKGIEGYLLVIARVDGRPC